ncbi:hypothetical protein BpHYR1_037720 [Brachionus plicatilis]|uniref:Uncharacterized protein n=1 Tax=Brachionus plicatilis TaxID=10195 RepID=A0A3M7SB88_BRAPC|nr:hypothetical protein BpHYR1_037720 [Brachionus plicatilis]
MNLKTKRANKRHPPDIIQFKPISRYRKKILLLILIIVIVMAIIDSLEKNKQKTQVQKSIEINKNDLLKNGYSCQKLPENESRHKNEILLENN